MVLTIRIELDGAAFEDGGPEEVARILADVAERLPLNLGITNGDYTLHDINGNWCGVARIDERAPDARDTVDALAAMVKHGERLNKAFYADGTAKALRPIMAEQKELLQKARAALGVKVTV